MRRRLFECATCGRQTSVTAGTIFQDTRSPLTVWFRAMWAVTSQKTGTSALTLQQVLGLGSYQTAWTWLHKLRRAMVRPGRDRLAGDVEVDETYVGGLEDGISGRGAQKKALIVVAAEDVGQRLGRIRLRRVPDASVVSQFGNLDHFSCGFASTAGCGMLCAKHMPKGPKGQKRPADVIGNAVTIMKIATGEIDESGETDDGKSKAAVELGRKGGQARAKKMSKARRTEIARRAAQKRWNK